MPRVTLAVLTAALTWQAIARAGDGAIGTVKVGAAAVELHVADDRRIAGGIETPDATGQDGVIRSVATVIQGPPHAARVAIVALDIVAFGRDHLDPAIREIERRTGIPFDNVIVNCTHNHHAPGTVKLHDFIPNPAFVQQVQNAVVEAVVKANEKLVSSPPIRMLFIMGREGTVGANSRIELRDGTVAWTVHPQSEQYGPTGPFDPDFPVMAFKRPDRSLAAVIFGHSTHNLGTPHPNRLSPGYYGLAAQAFEQESGALTTFIEGAAGSTHLFEMDSLKPDLSTFAQVFPQMSAEAERRILDAVRYHVDQAPEMSVARIGSLKREIVVKVRNFDEKQEEQAVSSYSKKAFGAAEGEKIAAQFRHDRVEFARHRGEERKTWLSVTRIGDVAIVGVPCELFTQLGLDIKARSPFRYTFIAELADDYVGYVGNADAYRLGGYQLWMGDHSWTERGTGELFVNESVKLLNELYLQ